MVDIFMGSVQGYRGLVTRSCQTSSAGRQRVRRGAGSYWAPPRVVRLYGVEHKGCQGSRCTPRRVAVASSSGCAGDVDVDVDVNTVTPSVGAGVKAASTSRHKSGARKAGVVVWNFGQRAQREGRTARGQRRSVRGLAEDGF